jgi:hypothetical protein
VPSPSTASAAIAAAVVLPPSPSPPVINLPVRILARRRLPTASGETLVLRRRAVFAASRPLLICCHNRLRLRRKP